MTIARKENLTYGVSHDLDYMAALLHGRRSMMAEGDGLDSLCRARGLADLARTLYPEGKIRSITSLQQQLLEDWVEEFSELIDYVPKSGAGLCEWMLVRFELENLKVLLRALATRRNRGGLEGVLVRVPGPRLLNIDSLAVARSMEELVQMLPSGSFREALEESVAQNRTGLFFMEAALDSAYFRELLARLDRISDQDQEVVRPVVCQEVDVFHLMLVVRGRFIFGLQPDLLLPFHVEGTQISKNRFEGMLGDRDLATAASRAQPVLDSVPATVLNASQRANPAIFEILAWKRYLRMSNRAFRRDPTGLGTVIGYAGLRRIEVANLITISEGVRVGLGSDSIRARVVSLEEPHV